MADHPLDHLSPSNRILRRAQTEPFVFTLLDGDVLVRNERYSDPENHEYVVRIVDGLPTTCTCPANAIYKGPCKHQVAVAIRRPIIAAAVEMQTLADGGTPSPVESDDDRDEDCEESATGCEHLAADFPCWECVRTGRRDLPER